MSLPETDKIIFYDIPGIVGSWGPNTWKTRFALNYKGIPYVTEWVEYPDIAPLLSSHGIAPNPSQSSSWQYTLPAIYDPRTKKTIMESYNIAIYLDETYPDTPSLLPPETRVFQTAFIYAFTEAVHKHFMPLMLYPTAEKLNLRSREYFVETREAALGIKLEDLSPPGSEKRAQQFVTLEKAFGVLTSWFDAAADGRLLLKGGSPEGGANNVSHADTAIAGVLIWARITFGEDSDEWHAVESYNNGRWKRYLAFFERWADRSK
ncbi:hypothetical protein DAEQUDRAFT_811967 [Daedalea quercina L-15889]|uniref:GST N-terminal domain-containing protein n=1 Tax=Daedalea quercina L-15889 TaxID=1314783 RepID=A0A165PWW8_9APHY|nr:hypothetical protein DAEQUDRAFT_811967 [Daedalea quercina L-15889]